MVEFPTSFVVQAMNLAIAAHGDQRYGASDVPHTKHLEEVVQVLADFGYTQDFWVVCGWLHDTIEDTLLGGDPGQRLIEAVFGTQVLKVILDVSGFGSNRKERQKNILEKISKNLLSSILKVADRIANVEACASSGSKYGPMYLQERDAFDQVIRKIGVPQPMLDRLDEAYGKIQYR